MQNIAFKVVWLGSALAWVGLGAGGVGENYDWNRENLEAAPQRALYFNHVLKWVISKDNKHRNVLRCCSISFPRPSLQNLPKTLQGLSGFFH